MNLQQFLKNQQYHQTIIDIILNIKTDPTQMYQKLNEENLRYLWTQWSQKYTK